MLEVDTNNSLVLKWSFEVILHLTFINAGKLNVFELKVSPKSVVFHGNFIIKYFSFLSFTL